MAFDPSDLSSAYSAFWAERHLCTLTTLRADGSPHVVPVGVTFDPVGGLARVISSSTSRKVRNIAEASTSGAGAPVAVCQVDGRRWATLEGRAVVREDTESVALAERLYSERYRPPRANPQRVVIEIAVTNALGHA